MNALQFSLFFAALLVAYLLVHVRLVRFETYLREVSALKVVNERLKGVSDSMTRVNLEPVEDRLDMIHAELRGLAEMAAKLEHTASRVREVSTPEVTASEPAGERIRGVVETRLLALGYRNLRLLTDISAATMSDEIEIVVEAERNQMPCKGRVLTVNGEVRDVYLQSVAQSFP